MNNLPYTVMLREFGRLLRHDARTVIRVLDIEITDAEERGDSQTVKDLREYQDKVREKMPKR